MCVVVSFTILGSSDQSGDGDRHGQGRARRGKARQGACIISKLLACELTNPNNAIRPADRWIGDGGPVSVSALFWKPRRSWTG